MPSAKSKKPKRAAIAKQQEQHSSLAALIIVLAAMLLVGMYIVYSLNIRQSSIAAFKSSYLSANAIAIYAVYDNANDSGSIFACASALITEAYSRSVKASAINFLIVTNNSCMYKQYIKGSSSSLTANYSTISIPECMSFSKIMPSIFVAYNSTNSTIVNGNILKVEGNSAFLAECGIAYSLV